MFRKTIYKIGFLIRLGFKYFYLAREYKFYKKNEFKSLEHNLQIQKQRLYQVVGQAVKNVPYYRKIAQENEIIISKETIFDDIKKFPILTKEVIRENWNDLHVELSDINYKIETSGGTTGEPIKIIHDWNYRLKNQAGTRFLDEIGGYSIGDKVVRLWGNEQEILNATGGKINHLINKYIKNTKFQNSFKMSEQDIERYVEEINKIRPKTIIAYVQSINEMAKFIKRKELDIYAPKSIIVSAGVLMDEAKAFLEEVFNCTVFNRYGSREMGNIAVSCEESDKLHINMFSKYVEILDDENRPLKEGAKGNIIITSLINEAMPLIRYKIGDVGSLNYSKCDCGRNLIRLDRVYGRTVDIFRNVKNEIIDGEYFTHLFYFKENIKQFQVIQNTIDQININLVTLNGKPLDLSIEKNFIKKIKIVMGNECQIKFNYVNDIPPSPSGKMRYTISNLEN